MDIRGALKGQYHAALQALRRAVEQCPDSLWTASHSGSPFWLVAYDALFFTVLYLQPDYATFEALERRRDRNPSDGLPWPPGEWPEDAPPPSRAEVIGFCRLADAWLDEAVDALDLEAATCGFDWYDLPKLDHQIMNIRHTQHHAGQLSDRLRVAMGAGVEWVGRG